MRIMQWPDEVSDGDDGDDDDGGGGGGDDGDLRRVALVPVSNLITIDADADYDCFQCT